MPTASKATIAPSSSLFARPTATAVAPIITAVANNSWLMSTVAASPLLSAGSFDCDARSCRSPRSGPPGDGDIEEDQEQQVGDLRANLRPRRAHLVEHERALDTGGARQEM